MEGISDIRIVGIDEKRPPRIRKEPYIDLVFRLSHSAPADWCQDFVELQAKKDYAAKINLDECLYIETWVRTPGEVVGQFEALKLAVADCTARYIAKIEATDLARDGGNEDLKNEQGPQGELNRIIAGLDFGE